MKIVVTFDVTFDLRPTGDIDRRIRRRADAVRGYLQRADVGGLTGVQIAGWEYSGVSLPPEQGGG